MIFRSKRKLNLKILNQYLVNGYELITVLYDIIDTYMLTRIKEIKLNINIVKYLKKASIVIY